MPNEVGHDTAFVVGFGDDDPIYERKTSGPPRTPKDWYVIFSKIFFYL